MIGVLLINLGTPAALTEKAVRDFLSEFLSDPHIITLPTWLRRLLLTFILKIRPAKTLLAYQKIWMTEGSPLLVNSQKLQNALQAILGEKYKVTLGMRYGAPSLSTTLLSLVQHPCQKIIILPLFPQFSTATTQSIFEAVHQFVHDKAISTPLSLIREFYFMDSYSEAIANSIRIIHNPNDFLLLSYHGLPKKHPGAAAYQTACLNTSAKIIKKLDLDERHTLSSFQSRFGAKKWLSPYTEKSLKILRKKGITRLTLVCPSFLTDCIETLEEINIRLRAQWHALGGEYFQSVPCLNENAAICFTDLLKEKLGQLSDRFGIEGKNSF